MSGRAAISGGIAVRSYRQEASRASKSVSRHHDTARSLDAPDALAGCGGSTTDPGPGADAGPTSIADGGAPSTDAPSEAAPGRGVACPPKRARCRRPPSMNKVDLLFDIDNSASMGDKQAYLAQAIPDLITRLVTPNCVDSGGNATGIVADVAGNCTTGTVEFTPVHDMHIGIVTSSLGPRLGDACPTTGAGSTQMTAAGIGRPAQRRSGSSDQPRERSDQPLRLHGESGGRPGHGRLPQLVPRGGDQRRRRAEPRRAAHRRFGAARARLPEHGRRSAPVRLRHRVAARELVSLPRSAGPVRVAGAGDGER